MIIVYAYLAISLLVALFAIVVLRHKPVEAIRMGLAWWVIALIVTCELLELKGK
jgi:hypothetical protein